MAFIGLKYAVFAPIDKETPGQAITYKSGIVLGRMIGANVDWERNSNALSADDMTSEDDNSILGGKIRLNVDDLSDEAQVTAVGVVKDGDGEAAQYREVGEAAPYGGVGYMRVRRKAGVTSYVAYWIHKTLLAMSNEQASTKDRQISWQTPSVEGTIMGVQINPDGKVDFRVHQTFKTEKEARDWLNTKANISAA